MQTDKLFYFFFVKDMNIISVQVESNVGVGILHLFLIE